MPQQAFAQYIDISTASLSSILNGRTKPTLNTVEAIRKSFPTINIEWLMFGTGTMFMAGKTPEPPIGGKEQLPKDDAEPALGFGMSDTDDKSDGKSTADDMSDYQSVKSTPNKNVIPAIKFIDKPQRHITEIRVYFDDLTFETFVPEK